MLETYILNVNHIPMPIGDMIRWGQWMETADLHLALTEGVIRLDGQRWGVSRISTVFLGLDHAFNGGPPILFETMVFDGPLDGLQLRYRSWDEAVATHDRIVADLGSLTHVSQITALKEKWL